MRNEVQYPGDRLSLACTQPATPASGDPVLFGKLPAVAQTDEGDGGNTSTNTSVVTRGVYRCPVKGQDDNSTQAITAGDIIYYDSAETGAKLNVDAVNGVRWGYALEDVAAGEIHEIDVYVGY